MKEKIDLLDHVGQYLESYLKQIFPNGEIRGREFVMGDIQGNRGDSFSINLDKGTGADFATGDSYNIITLIAAKYNLSKADAAAKIKQDWGLEKKREIKKVADDKPTPIIPVPEGKNLVVPRFFINKYGNKMKPWRYRDINNNLVMYVLRFDNQSGKDYIPFYYAGDDKWHSGHLTPRPLYNLQRLKGSTISDTIVIHEGEKATDAGERLLPSNINLSWCGGSGQAKKADWEQIPLNSRIIILRDNDEPGIKAQNAIAEILHKRGCKIRILTDNAFEGKPTGWDAADALEEGYTELSYGSWLQDNLTEFSPRREAVGTEAPQAKEAKNIPSPINQYYKVLGLHNTEYLFYNYASGQVYNVEYSRLDKKLFYALTNGDTEYWARTYGIEIKKRNQTEIIIDWDQAGADHMRQAVVKGQFPLNRLRGRGTWIDGDRIVTNTGEYLYVDSNRIPIQDYESKYVYIKKPQIIETMENALDYQSRSMVLEMCQCASWEVADAAKLLAGWLMVAPIAGALEWRPHIYLCGMAGSGKTTIYEKIISPLLGNFKYSFTGDTTAPGIRRYTRGDSLPLTIDEFEINARNDDNRIAAILDIARASSDANEAVSAKAGAGSSDSVTYNLTAAFCFISITPSAKNFADITRISPLALRPINNQQSYEKLLDLSYILSRNKNLSDEFITYASSQVYTIKESYNIIHAKAVKLKLFSARCADQIGTLLAGYWAYCHEEPITEQQAEDLLLKLDINSIIPQKEEENQYKLLSKIAQYTVYFSNEAIDHPRQFHRTIAELIEYVTYHDKYDHKDNTNFRVDIAERLLRNIGIRYKSDIGGIVISNTSEALQKILVGTQWATNWNHSLKSLAGAKPADKPIHFSTTIGTHRGVILPVSAFVSVPEEEAKDYLSE